MAIRHSPTWLRLCLALACSVSIITGCGTRPHGTGAPVDDRGTMPRDAGAGSSSPSSGASSAKTPSGIENAGKPGYYTVRPGDTMIRIGLESGQSWRDIARWNNIENPNLIEVGQVLRIIAPSVASAGAPSSPASAAPAPAPDTTANKTPSPPPPSTGVASTGAATPGARSDTQADTSKTKPSTPSASDEDLKWIWPVSGGAAQVIATFDEVKNKGLGISGKPGEAVLAASDGRVVYAGAGLRGYGNLIILKHNSTYLSAYAHNQTLLVKEDQNVRQGQKIAEMGSSDADRTKLHFEIRRQGKPIDPQRLLPAR